MSTDPAEILALFRYHVVADATNPRLSPAERGETVRHLSRQSHVHPDGSARRFYEGSWSACSEIIMLQRSIRSPSDERWTLRFAQGDEFYLPVAPRRG